MNIVTAPPAPSFPGGQVSHALEISAISSRGPRTRYPGWRISAVYNRECFINVIVNELYLPFSICNKNDNHFEINNHKDYILIPFLIFAIPHLSAIRPSGYPVSALAVLLLYRQSLTNRCLLFARPKS